MSDYAARTVVPVEKSQAEVRKILNAHGCSKFALVDDGPRTIIQSVLSQKSGTVMLRFTVTAPGTDDPKVRFAFNSGEARMRESRRRWRCLVVMLKAKFAAVESGITTFQDEFLAHVCLPGGETVGEWAGREVGPAIAAGRMPTMLALGEGTPDRRAAGGKP